MSPARTARGFSLVEVIIAAGVLAVMMLPVFLTWSSTRSSAAQDAREVLAANLAAEMLEQVIAVKRYNGFLNALGDEDQGGPVDLDELKAREPKGVGITLYPTVCCGRTSRIFLANLPRHFRRTLSITPEVVGGDNGFFGPQIVWRVTARVIFSTPRTGAPIERDVTLTTLVFDEKRSKS